MTRSERLVVVFLGGAFLLSAPGARGQRAANMVQPARPGTGAAAIKPAPRTPADMPPNPPTISCSGDTLSIVARNSTLASVLTAVRLCTGVEIVVPEGSAGERLFAEVGPGPVRSVLTDFLNSTDFNYVVEASPSDPQRVQTVLLSLRADDSQSEVASNGNVPPNWRAWLEAQQNHGQGISEPQEGSGQEVDAALTEPVENRLAVGNENPIGGSATNPEPELAVTASASSEIESASSASGDSQSEGKDTSELVAELQHLYQQRKQMIQRQRAPAQDSELAMSAGDGISH